LIERPLRLLVEGFFGLVCLDDVLAEENEEEGSA